MNKLLRQDYSVITDTFAADNFLRRLLGYMFQKEPKYPSIIIKPCNSIHSFFMKFNIDVFFLNKNMEIIKIVENLPANKVIIPVKEGIIVVEAKAGTLKGLQLGDKIILV